MPLLGRRHYGHRALATVPSPLGQGGLVHAAMTVFMEWLI